MDGGKDMHQHGVVELAAPDPRGSPPRNVQRPAPSATFVSPAGRRFTASAFAHGDRWAVRFSPCETGLWHWTMQAADGVALAAGSFGVRPSESDSAWRRHGPVAVHPSGRAFAHQDGTPAFWLADTVWAAPAHATLPEWRDYLERRRAQGFNVVQINALPQWDASGPPLRLPFAPGADLAEPDPSYWSTLDAMVAAAADAGMLVAMVVLWFDNTPDDNPDWARDVPRRGPFTTDEVGAFARYLVARYEAFGVVWFVSGDTGFSAPRAVALYDAAARAIMASAARPPLVTAHLNGGTAPPAALDDRPWLGFHVFQSCHFADSADRARRYAAAARAFPDPRPVLNSEPCYDGLVIMGPGNATGARFGREDVRRTSWISVLSGAGAGISYGAHGLWPWHRAGNAYGPLHYGLPPDWRDALAWASADDLARLRRFIETLPWWDIAPARPPAAGRPERILASATAGPHSLILYLAGGTTLSGVTAAGRDVVAEWFDPCTGVRSVSSVPAGHGGDWTIPQGGDSDMVLVLHTRPRR